MGGKDVIYMKQQHSSALQPADVQKRLKVMADKRFLDAAAESELGSEHTYQNDKVWIILVILLFVMKICNSIRSQVANLYLSNS